MTTQQDHWEITELAEKLCLLAPQLAEEIAHCCEQAYRRGYQQGGLYGHGINDQVASWRFNRDGCPAHYAIAKAPPDTTGEKWGYTCTALERLEMEASNASTLVAAICKSTPN